MRYGKCICCNNIRKLIVGKVCGLCVEGLKKSFVYSIDGKQLSKSKYNTIVKRGYVIPEEIEEIRND